MPRTCTVVHGHPLTTLSLGGGDRGRPRSLIRARQTCPRIRRHTTGNRAADRLRLPNESRPCLVAAAYVRHIRHPLPARDTGFHPLDGARLVIREIEPSPSRTRSGNDPAQVRQRSPATANSSRSRANRVAAATASRLCRGPGRLGSGGDDPADQVDQVDADGGLALNALHTRLLDPVGTQLVYQARAIFEAMQFLKGLNSQHELFGPCLEDPSSPLSTVARVSRSAQAA